MKAEDKNPPQTEQAVLDIKDLHKTFGKKVVHRGISFQLRPREILGLFGGSGSGKSVILRSIIGLERPDRGSILFHGKELTGLSERELFPIRTQIAYVFQNGALFDSLTVEENLSYPLKEHTSFTPGEIEAKVSKILEQLDLKNSQKLYPSELSGGMQKRAGLARAIILEPEVILFDEPTAGLDPINTKRLVAHLLNLKKEGVTGILVTHDIPAAFEIADRIAVIYNGTIYAIQTPEELKKSEDPFIQSFLSGTFEHSQESESHHG